MSKQNIEKALRLSFSKPKDDFYRQIAKDAIKNHNRNQRNKKWLMVILLLLTISILGYYWMKSTKEEPIPTKKEFIAQVIQAYPYERTTTRGAFQMDSIYAGFVLLKEAEYERAISFLEQSSNEAKFYLAIAYLGNDELERTQEILRKLPEQKAQDLQNRISKLSEILE